MTELSKINKAALKALLRSTGFEAVERTVIDLIDEWRSEGATGTSEFEALKGLFIREGRVEGVRALLDRLQALTNE